MIPSQVSGITLRAQASDGLSSTDTATANNEQFSASSAAAPVYSSNPNQKRKRRRHKKSTTNSAQTTKADYKPRRSGDLPDIYWRSITMADLRHHPRVQALPLPENIAKLESLEDIRYFSQESWQWDAVHEGRCTTSQAVAALGFLEPRAGKILGVPRSWQRGGSGAYYRLRKQALRTLDEMNEFLCAENNKDGDTKEPTKDSSIWTADVDGNIPFAAKHNVQMTQEEMQERKKLSKRLSRSSAFSSSIRMMWGNAQEATALLTALNYFWGQDDGVILKEVGMCGGGLQMNQTNGGGSSLLVGATPDGLLSYRNGTVEVLEVKNHCPFFATSPGGSRHHQQQSSGQFAVRGFDFTGCSVPPQYVPQLMMEMLCVGTNCRSAIMVRQTATSGALILRIRRDDVWIDEMLYWLNRFQEDFVEQESPPPTNFFLEGGSTEDASRYMAFLERTKAMQDTVEVVAHVPHSQIQRASGTHPGKSDLFLD